MLQTTPHPLPPLSLSVSVSLTHTLMYAHMLIIIHTCLSTSAFDLPAVASIFHVHGILNPCSVHGCITLFQRHVTCFSPSYVFFTAFDMLLWNDSKHDLSIWALHFDACCFSQLQIKLIIPVYVLST